MGCERMRAYMVASLLLACALVTSCTTSTEEDLSSTDINNISAALSSAFRVGLSTPQSAVLSFDESGALSFTPNLDLLAPEVAVNAQAACPGGGLISVTGNINVDPQAGTFNALFNFYVGDPTNNLNDCDVGNGVIVDGRITVTVSGSLAAWSGNMNGNLTINRRGSGGGLVRIAPNCNIFITYFTNGSASGTICGHSVSA